MFALYAIALLAACSDSSPQSDTVHVSINAEPAGVNCADGGHRIDVTQNSSTTTSYVCNGGTGSAATVTVGDEPPGANCATGGVAITSSSGGSTVTSYVCNGEGGVVATAEPGGTNCAAGGVKLVDSQNAVSFLAVKRPAEPAPSDPGGRSRVPSATRAAHRS